MNKNISSVEYNSLNLPSRITYSDGRMAEYVYSAAGAKLSTTYTNGLTTTGNVYCGNMIYENGTLKQILVDGGYVTFCGSTPTYHFYLKDHLGNNRVVASGDGTIEQVNHYYPYGGLMGESTGGDHQRYKYNGKELDRMHGLDWYDYGARHMDGARGQFTSIDPLAGKYYNISPYVYCVNNPVRFIDVKGLFPKGVLTLHKTNFYRANYYTFTKPAAHLLSLVTGIKEYYIRGVNVMEKGLGREFPAYNPNNGGGGITIGSDPNNVTMTFTKNYFADNKSDYNGNGYGQDVYEWLSIVSHEATHIKHIGQVDGKIQYVVHFIKQYLKFGHDNTPEEKEADANRDMFQNFNSFVMNNYGENSIQELFNSELSDGQKIQQIDAWWKEWQESERKE